MTLIVLIWEDIRYLSILLGVILILSILGGVRACYMATILKFMLPVMLLILAIQGFLNSENGTTVLFQFSLFRWSFIFKKEGLLYGVMICERLLCLILILPPMLMSSPINDLVMGMVKLHIPFKFAFVLSTALRFVPQLMDEAGQIMNAQRLRGIDLDKMGVLKKVKIYARIIVPLMLGPITRSINMEIALQSKAFTGSANRTYIHAISLRVIDVVLIVLVLVGMCMAIVARTMGYGTFMY